MTGAIRIIGKYSAISFNDKVDLPNVSGEFAELFRFEGLGNLYSMITRFNNTNVIIKVILDDTTIIELDITELESNFLATTNFFLSVDATTDVLIFKPTFPVLFRRNIIVMAKANSGSNSRDFEFGILELSEE